MAEDQSTQQSGGVWPTSAGETEPGGLVPPYEGRTTARGEQEVSDELSDTVDRQLDDTDMGRPGATTSPPMESAVQPGEVSHGASGSGAQTATDPTATTPGGVGGSITRRGEDVKEQEGTEPGKADLGPRGASQRPSGTSDQRTSTGVDPQELADEDMPDSFTGDMGG
jgi:hypothetical protein